jgi:tRNA-Thr(GGU) m(6)t(6)A37 methyltransferase TsaA
MPSKKPSFQISPIGHIEKVDDLTCIVVYEPYTEALLNIEHFSHIIVLWWISGRDTPEDRKVLQTKPKRETAPWSGVFSCRAPMRPNPIGLSIVALETFEQPNRLIVDRIDAFHESPVIDLKPYIPASESIPSAKLPEWFADLRSPRTR